MGNIFKVIPVINRVCVAVIIGLALSVLPANAESITCTKNVSKICKTDSVQGVKFSSSSEVFSYGAARNAAKKMMSGGKGICIGLGNIYSVSGSKAKQRGLATKSKSVRRACRDLGL